MFAGASLFWSRASIAVERWSLSMQKKLGLSHPYRIWGKEKESQICGFRYSQPLHRVVSLLTLQEQSSQTGQNFGRRIQNKKLMRHLELCLLTTKALHSFNSIFFPVLLLLQQNEIQPSGINISLVFKAVWPWKTDVKFSHAYVSDEC